MRKTGISVGVLVFLPILGTLLSLLRLYALWRGVLVPSAADTVYTEALRIGSIWLIWLLVILYITTKDELHRVKQELEKAQQRGSN